MIKSFFKIVVVFLIAIIIASCGRSYKNITYIQDRDGVKDTVFKNQFTRYKLRPADILYINIKTLDEDADKTVNISSTSNPSGSIYVSSYYYINGYTINAEGYVTIPIIGKIKLEGLTQQQANDTIQSRVNVVIKDALAIVKLVSFKVSVLGEVGSPGIVNIMNDRANIFEVIAMAGDITYYGNRKQVEIVRNMDDGVRVFTVDLTKRDLLSSEQFYLKPNDIVYVRPLHLVNTKLFAADYSVVISAVMSILTLSLLIYRL